MSIQLFATRTYERAIRKLVSGEARKELEAAIAPIPAKHQLSEVREAFASSDGQVLGEASGAASGRYISTMLVRKLFTY